jgi:hypothetical protein
MALKQIETWKINKERHGKYFPTNKEKYGKYFPTRQDKRMYEQMWFEKKANSPQPPSKNLEAHKDKPELLQQIHNFFHQPDGSRQIIAFLAIIFVFAFLYIIGTWSYDSKPKPSLTIGVSHGQIMMHLDNFILLSKRLFTDKGEPRYMGSTTDHLTQVEIIGNENDVLVAAVKFWVPNDAPEIVVRDSGISLRFIKNTVPEWEGGGDWLNSALDRIMSTKRKMGEEKIIIGNKAITLFVAPPTITIVVKHKDAI